jgi:protein required for attachment to host cells
MKRNWILVANQAEAQIYSSDRLPGSLSLVEVLANDEGTSRARDLVSDAPGRAYDSHGSGRHAMEPNTGVKEEQRRRFVKEMVERLQTARVKGDFDQLVLLAAPGVLGVIRKTLNPELEKTVIKEIPKDLIGQDVEKIQSQLVRAFALV